MSQRFAIRPGESPEAAVTPPAAGPGLTVGAVPLWAALGVLVVAAANSAGRLGYSGSAWADAAYWAGQALIVLPVAVRLLSRRLLAGADTVALVLTLAVAEYLVKICYSPAAFTFADELVHWRGTENLLQTGQLFGVNYALPVAPHYPGLEEAASALASVTGLPVFVAGLIVAGMAHLLLVCFLYLLFQGLLGSHRAAGIAVFVYAGNQGFSFFSSMFAYETLALAFFGLALFAVWRLCAPSSAGPWAGWLVIAVLAILATVMTHHVTSYILAVMLALMAAGALAAGDRRAAAWSGGLALATAAAVATWLITRAPQTADYFAPVARGVLDAFRGFARAGAVSGPPLVRGPLGNLVLGGAALLIMSAVLPAGIWLAVRRYRRSPWVLAMAVGSLSWYAIVAVRLVVADGSELAGRAAPFVFIPAGFTAALAVHELAVAGLRRYAAGVAAAATAGVLVLMFDGLANGWPPYWERLPGAYQAGGFERSAGPEDVAAATWALTELGPGNRFAADLGNAPVIGGYGDQDPVYNDAYVYLSAPYDPVAVVRVEDDGIAYVLVDERLSRLLPASGAYFPGQDPGAGRYTRPLPPAGLAKFDHIPGIARVYDSGSIVIYGLKGSSYYVP